MADEAVTDLRLAERRRKKGVALEQISQATKIGMRALRAIEAGEFQKLPGGVYSTSYIRQYARAIEFDESEILSYYHSRTDVQAETPLINAEKRLNLRDLNFLVQH